MTQAETLTKLRTLLERVRSRSRVPMPEASVPAAVAAPVITHAVQRAPAAPEAATWSPPAPKARVEEPSIDVDVEEAEATDVDVASRAEAGPTRRDSDERLVAAQEVPSDLVQADPFAPAEPGEPIDLAADSEPAIPLPVEPAPASSRRPVEPEPDDQLDRMAFGAEEAPPPIHTPPPESGRLPAAPGAGFDADLAESGTSRSQAVMAPQATKATLEDGGRVASVTGAAPRPAPSTFGELLDATLAL